MPATWCVINGPASHLELMWEEPRTARTLRTMAEFARLIMFDRRGTGLSDPVSEPPTLEQQVDDLRAVLAAVGRERVSIIGGCDLGLSALFAATYPEQVSALVLSGVAADGEHTLVGRGHEQMLDAIENSWGDGTLVSLFAPSQVGNPEFVEWWGRMQRSAVSPGMARKLMEMTAQTNLRAILPTIRVPTLVVHGTGDRVVPVECGREVAGLIPGARFVEYEGEDAYMWCDPPGLLDIEEFLTGRRSAPRRPRAGHGHVHRHRRLDRAPLAARRPALARRSSRTTTGSSARGLRRWRGQRDQDLRRRLPGHLRRAGPGGQLRRGDRRGAWPSSGWRSAPGCTPANASCATTTSPGSPSTSPRA